MPPIRPLLSPPRSLRPPSLARPGTARSFSTTPQHRSSPLFNIGGLSTSRESQFLAKEHRLPRSEYSAAQQLIRSSEVDPFAPSAPGASKEAIRRALAGGGGGRTASAEGGRTANTDLPAAPDRTAEHAFTNSAPASTDPHAETAAIDPLAPDSATTVPHPHPSPQPSVYPALARVQADLDSFRTQLRSCQRDVEALAAQQAPPPSGRDGFDWLAVAGLGFFVVAAGQAGLVYLRNREARMVRGLRAEMQLLAAAAAAAAERKEGGDGWDALRLRVAVAKGVEELKMGREREERSSRMGRLATLFWAS